MFRKSSLQFNPPYKTIHDYIMSIYDELINIVIDLKRIEHKLNDNHYYTPEYLKVI